MLDKEQLKEITNVSVPKIIEQINCGEISGIVAASTEAMIPASLISTLICLPLYSISDDNKLSKVEYTLDNGGTRKGRFIEQDGQLLFVDLKYNKDVVEKISEIVDDFQYVCCDLPVINNTKRNKENKTVVIINHESTLTGAPIFAQDMANWMQENSEATVIFLDQRPNELYELNEEIEVRYYNNNHMSLLHELRDIQPTLIYANSLSLMSRISKLYEEYLDRTIFHFHECTRDLIQFLLGPEELYTIIKKAKAVLYVAEEIKKNMLDVIKESLWYEANDNIEEKLHFCPEFIHSDRIKRIKENDTNRPDNERPLIGMCGVRSERKNVSLFLELAEVNPSIDFVWIGANIKSNLKNFSCIKSCKNPYVHFNKLDYFLLTSLRDPCPIVVLENMLLNNKVILLDKNIKYEHKISELENVYVIRNHDNDPLEISDYLKSMNVNTKQNETNKNSEYIMNNFSCPKAKDMLLCCIRQEKR